MHQAVEQSHVRARLNPQPEISPFCQLGPARINHHQFCIPFIQGLMNTQADGGMTGVWIGPDHEKEICFVINNIGD